MRWLYIMRHGHAEDEDPRQPGDDSARRLTALGEAQARAVGRSLARLPHRPARILTSPWTRARQTAEGVAEAIGVPVEFAPQLIAHASADEVCADLLSRVDEAPLLLVSHEPLVHLLTAALVARGPVRAYFERAGVAAVVWHPYPSGPRGELVFWAPPEVLAPELLTIDPESA
jgi:phosphohistidine phosphatase